MRQRNKILERYGDKNLKSEMQVLFSEGAENLSNTQLEELELQNAYYVESSDLDTGEIKNVLYLIDQAGNIYATVSATFIDNFLSMADWSREQELVLKKIKIETSKSKKGRDFLKCSPLVIYDKEGNQL